MNQKSVLYLFVAIGLLAALAVLAWINAPSFPTGPPQFTVSKTNTYFTGPLRDDGSIDFAAALNEKHGANVEPDQNACRYLQLAFGPYEDAPDSFYADLGIERPAIAGDYLVDIREIMADLNVPPEQREAIFEQTSTCMMAPWSADDRPEVAALLEANHVPLRQIEKAVACDIYYQPIVFKKGAEQGDVPPLLLTAISFGSARSRAAGRLLSTRAMLKLNNGDVDGAWNDLIACRRLGRLVSNGPVLIDLLVGYSVEEMSTRGMLALLETTRLTDEQIARFREDLATLPPMVAVATKIDEAERCWCIDATLAIAYGRVTSNELMGGGKKSKTPANLDWDVVLATCNGYYDRLIQAIELPTHLQRQAAMEGIGADLSTIDPREGIGSWTMSRKETSEAFGRILMALMLPAATRTKFAEDRLAQAAINLDAMLAIQAFRNQHERYPDRLDELVPDFVDELPMDLFADGPLIYKVIPDGYEMYSYGPNRKDENANGDRPADDVGIIMDGRIEMPKR